MDERTITIPPHIADLIDSRVGNQDYRSSSDYVAELVVRDNLHVPLTMEQLRARLQNSRDSGESERSIDDMREEGLKRARARGLI